MNIFENDSKELVRKCNAESIQEDAELLKQLVRQDRFDTKNIIKNQIKKDNE